LDGKEKLRGLCVFAGNLLLSLNNRDGNAKFPAKAQSPKSKVQSCLITKRFAFLDFNSPFTLKAKAMASKQSPKSSDEPFKPSKRQLAEAKGKTVPDVIAKDLRVLFCGINPGLYTAAVGHHFARPGNRFWPALHKSGFTDRLLSPFDERELLKANLGITNVVADATASASEVTKEDFVEGGRALKRKVRRYRPRIVAILGIEAYRKAFGRMDIELGEQEETVGDARLWVLPNPSGLNANYQLKDFTRLFRKLRKAAE